MAGISLSSGFDLNSPLPLDSRTVVDTLVARDALESGKRYEGMKCYIKSEKREYQLIGGVLNSHWKDIASSSKQQVFVATANQTLFNLSGSYVVGENRIQVVVGGVPQYSPSNFTETSTTSFTFTSGIPVGLDVVATYF